MGDMERVPERDLSGPEENTAAVRAAEEAQDEATVNEMRADVRAVEIVHAMDERLSQETDLSVRLGLLMDMSPEKASRTLVHLDVLSPSAVHAFVSGALLARAQVLARQEHGLEVFDGS